MSKSFFSNNDAVSGYCRKCGKSLNWGSTSMIAMENTTSCMVSANHHIQELQTNVAKNTRYCSTCRTKINDDIILNIVLFPFTVIKLIIKLFKR